MLYSSESLIFYQDKNNHCLHTSIVLVGMTEECVVSAD